MSEIVPVTRGGHARLQAELQELKQVARPRIIAAIAEARAHGDLKENAEYHAAKEKQGFIEGRIAFLEEQLAKCRIVDLNSDNFDIVRFGVMVTLTDEQTGKNKTYQLVGDLEANVDERRISINSPLGKAIIGKKLDSLVTVKAPKGAVEYVVRAIRCP